MKLNELLKKLTNGETHILLYDDSDGTVLCKTIWINQIPGKLLNMEVDHIQVLDYELRIGISS